MSTLAQMSVCMPSVSPRSTFELLSPDLQLEETNI